VPRQLIRLSESRESDDFDDQKTPTQIQSAETLSENHQQFLTFVLSQIRQILGTPNWNDPVPATLLDILIPENTFPAICLATDAVGDCVYPRADPLSGEYRVTKCDPYDLATLPAVGIISEKTSGTDCRVQYAGPLAGVYGGLDREYPVFLAADGGLTQDRPLPGPNPVWVQFMGRVLGSEELMVAPNHLLTKLKP